MRILSLMIFILTTVSYSNEQIYSLLYGLWNAHSEGPMDIILNVDTSGKFDMSVIPAFEFTNLTASEQSNVISSSVSTKGYFKVLKVLKPIDTGSLIESEVLLNDEITTNILNITPDNVFMVDTNHNTQTPFMRKSSF